MLLGKTLGREIETNLACSKHYVMKGLNERKKKSQLDIATRIFPLGRDKNMGLEIIVIIIKIIIIMIIIIIITTTTTEIKNTNQ